MCRTFTSLPHFSKFAALFQVCRTFPSVPTFTSLPHFFKCAHFYKCAALFQVWRIFPIVPQFSECGALFQFCCIFSNVPHFSKFGALFWACALHPWCYWKLEPLSCWLFHSLMNLVMNHSHLSMSFFIEADLYWLELNRQELQKYWFLLKYHFLIGKDLLVDLEKTTFHVHIGDGNNRGLFLFFHSRVNWIDIYFYNLLLFCLK